MIIGRNKKSTLVQPSECKYIVIGIVNETSPHGRILMVSLREKVGASGRCTTPENGKMGAQIRFFWNWELPHHQTAESQYAFNSTMALRMVSGWGRIASSSSG